MVALGTLPSTAFFSRFHESRTITWLQPVPTEFMGTSRDFIGDSSPALSKMSLGDSLAGCYALLRLCFSAPLVGVKGPPTGEFQGMGRGELQTEGAVSSLLAGEPWP